MMSMHNVVKKAINEVNLKLKDLNSLLFLKFNKIYVSNYHTAYKIIYNIKQ